MLPSVFTQAQLAAAAATNPADSIPIISVVLTGVALVFAILLILILVIQIQGAIFGAIERKKKEQVTPPPAPAKAAAPAPVVEDGISPQVVAAIVAAVSAASGGAYVLRAVSTAKKGRGAWGLAGVIQSTEPF